MLGLATSSLLCAFYPPAVYSSCVCAVVGFGIDDLSARVSLVFLLHPSVGPEKKGHFLVPRVLARSSTHCFFYLSCEYLLL